MSDASDPDPPTEVSPPPRSLGGRRASVGLLLLALVCTFWYRSRNHADLLWIHGNGGCAGGVMSLRGQVLVGFSSVSMGQPWVAFTQSASIEDGVKLRDALRDTPDITQQWRFLVARHKANAFGIPGKWCTVVGVPHWVFLPFALWPIGCWIHRRLRLRRRRRSGWCMTCGYDLRGANTRCPECGTPPVQRERFIPREQPSS